MRNLSLSPKFKIEINSSRHLKVGTLGDSQFNNEKERLFAGMTVLSIINIYDMTDMDPWSGHNKHYLNVMLYFERIVEQTIHNREHYCHGVITDKNKAKWIEKQNKYLIIIFYGAAI